MNYKRFLLLFLILIFSCQPIAYAKTIGYTNKGCYVYARPSTSAAKRWVSVNTKLYYVGTYGKFFVVQVAGYKTKVCILKQYVSREKTIKKPTKNPETSSWKSKVEKISWSKGKNLLKVNKTAQLYSVNDGIILTVKRTGGLNHIDLEPLTKNDTKQLWHISKGYFSWQTYPMILKVNNRFIACSINTLPHGRDKLKGNDFEGCFCLHLIESKTHGTNVVNPEHQKQINIAYNWAHRS